MNKANWLIEFLGPISDGEIDILKEHIDELIQAADKAVDDGEKPSEAIIIKAKEILALQKEAKE